MGVLPCILFRDITVDYYTTEMIKRYARIITGRPFAPVLLNLLITSICDMRCVHCFFTEELDDKPRKARQMTSANLERISETLGANLGVLIVAGGEPFTRKDLPQMAETFYRNNRLESLYLMSNGQIQKRIFEDVVKILDSCPRLNLTIALGIDGLKEEHEKIRQKPGSWDIATGTARRLQEIKKQYPRLDIQTCTCLMKSNQDRIFDWYEFLKRELKPDKINVNYIRPPSAVAEELEIDKSRYHRLVAMIDADSRAAMVKNYYSGKEGFFKAAIDIYMHQLIDRTVNEDRQQLRCWAGSAGAVIYDEGTVSSCEILGKVANLRDYDWDFSALWYSPAMQDRRRRIASGCYCTHESNCYYPSLAFNPTHLIKIKQLERQMKLSAAAT